MKTYRDFFTSVLRRLHIEPHPRVLNALMDVAVLEGLNDRYNPLNSVVPCGKSTAFNSVGVQDYKSYGNGVNGTVRLLRGDPWTGVVDAMRRGATTHAILAEFSKVYATWNSHPNWPGGNGRVLDEPLGGGTPIEPPAPKPAKHHNTRYTYTVKRGDTLYNIAGTVFDGANGRWQEIARTNKIIPPYVIYAGQKLTIPNE